MGRTRHTRKRHVRRKHKRRRTRHRRRTRRGSGNLVSPQSPMGGYKESFITPTGGGKKAIIFSDFPPGYRDKAARAAFRKMERKSRKHKRKRKSRKRKRRRRKH